MRHEPEKLLSGYAPEGQTLQAVREHGRKVWDLALAMTRHLREVDFTLLYRASLLHDMGRFQHHPGSERAIRHGLAGAAILEREGLPREARVAERHIGIGITAEDVQQQGLPLPVADFVPRTLVEHVVAYADNLDGKGIRDEKDVEEKFARDIGPRYRERSRRFNRRVHRLLGL